MANTVPMIAPDGSIGDVPQDRVAEAVKEKYKIGQEMVAADGKTRGVIPLDHVHDAIASGNMQLIGAQPDNLKNLAQPQEMTSANYIPPDRPGSYNGSDTGPLGDLSGGKAGAYEQGTSLHPEAMAKGAAITAAAAGGEGLQYAAGYGMEAGKDAVHPIIEALAPHVPDLAKVVQIAKILGYGSLGLKEVKELLSTVKHK